MSFQGNEWKPQWSCGRCEYWSHRVEGGGWSLLQMGEIFIEKVTFELDFDWWVGATKGWKTEYRRWRHYGQLIQQEKVLLSKKNFHLRKATWHASESQGKGGSGAKALCLESTQYIFRHERDATSRYKLLLTLETIRKSCSNYAHFKQEEIEA